MQAPPLIFGIFSRIAKPYSTMPNDHHTRPSRFSALILSSCLLFWLLNAGILPVSAFQNAETSTPTFIQTDITLPTEEPGTETPVPTGSPADAPVPTGTDPAATEAESTAAEVPELLHRPLPAVFASGAYAQDELVVRFKASTSRARIGECFQGIDIQIQSEIEELRAFVLRTLPGEVGNSFYHMLDCAGVLYVEPNFLLQAADTLPNDPNWGLQYGLVNIRAPQGWDLGTGSTAVTIAIVDSGVDYGHPDLAGKLRPGYDFVNSDNNPQDDNGHGTHVAGIAAASSNNATGIAGVSWGARIMPVKVLNASGGGTYANTADGVIWAVDHGAQVINLSLGGTGPASILADAINYAHGKGAVVVAAAGNAGNNFVLYPARYPNVIAVARTDGANHWNHSNYGPEIDLSAPGLSIFSTVIGGYEYKSGSSMSTGFVSGLAAILMGIPGNASPDRIETQMESTALDIEYPGWDEYTGAGLIQMDRAIDLALGSVRPTEGTGNPSGAGGSGPAQIAVTNTPIPLWTASLTLETQTVTATPTFEPGSTLTESKTLIVSASASPAGSADEVEAQGESGHSNYVLPCAGLALIGLGLLLLLAFRKK